MDPEQKKCGIINLVVDSAGFLKNVPLKDIGENIYTDEGVVNEIKDKSTKERLQVLPYQLNFKRPSCEDIKFVTEFTKKTGDYCSLSAVDLRVIALTYHLEKEFVGQQNIRSQPFEKELSYGGKGQLPLGFYFEKETNRKQGKQESLSNEMENLIIESTEEHNDDGEDSEKYHDNDDGEDDENEEDSGEDHDGDDAEDDENGEESGEDGDDDDEGWVTINNIKNAKETGCDTTELNPDEPLAVACLSTDYAIQNVLIQMGLKVVSVDGMLIRQSKMYLLRCFACFKTTTDMTKKFCPHCGNMTLRKTSYSINEDGTVTYYMSKKQPNKKGLKYSLPTPKGGKYSNNPILCADQRIPQQKTTRIARAAVDPFDSEYIAGDSPFAVKDVNSKATMLGFGVRKPSEGRWRNPNENKRKHSNRK